MKAPEYRNMDEAVLFSEIEKSKRELLGVRCKVALGEEVHPHMVKLLRRDIARMMTVLSEKKAALAAQGGNA